MDGLPASYAALKERPQKKSILRKLREARKKNRRSLSRSIFRGKQKPFAQIQQMLRRSSETPSEDITTPKPSEDIITPPPSTRISETSPVGFLGGAQKQWSRGVRTKEAKENVCQSEAALTELASKHKVGAPFVKWEPDKNGSSSGYLTVGRLSEEDGWKSIEEYGNTLNVGEYKKAVEEYVDKLFDSPLRAANVSEWHGGNVFYNNETNEILRIDWDPEEGACYKVGCPEPLNGIKTKEQYLDTLFRLGEDTSVQLPAQPSINTNKLTMEGEKVIKRIASRKSTEVYSPPRFSPLSRRKTRMTPTFTPNSEPTFTPNSEPTFSSSPGPETFQRINVAEDAPTDHLSSLELGAF